MNTKVRLNSTSDWPPKGPDSFLREESFSMEMQRRESEQQGQRKLAKVHVKEHEEPPAETLGNEGKLENDIREHPMFALNQRFDGVDKTNTPVPALDPESKTKFENEKREQEKEKQLRLGNMPQFGNKYTPKPL